jgi:aminopeptidase
MKDMLKKYARLIVRTGVNLQKGQLLVLNSPVECAAFTRILAEEAYQEGAGDVIISWKDEVFSRIRFLHAPEKVFEEFPQWQREFYLSYMREGAAFVSIAASDPELMKDVDPNRLAKAQKTNNEALKEYRASLMNNKNVWCVVSVPTESWAKRVFPQASPEGAVEKLWQAIFKAVRVDTQDPVNAWEIHKRGLRRTTDVLNQYNFKFLNYKNSLGTNLTIELPQNHIWLGGSEYSTDGVEFIANMPTEEVFTVPKKTGVNGTVVCSKPLNYNGNLIEHFALDFVEGKIVAFRAEKGYEILKQLIETDDGSHYLGEVALVPHDSPISNSQILFFNTLFDENASCHLAIGKAYPVCIKGGKNMGAEKLEKLGINDSLTHEDFMIGTADLEITGLTSTGETVPVFKNGNIAF